MIKMIEVSKIHPHPHNPRKEIGNITELAESIKQNGVLQNLTVVPKGPDDETEYTAVIGHRRLAASILAGLTKVPCVIADMSEKEQIATMLLENMQRSDLTVFEQALGFQMMLDLGETVSDISTKTGFSESTVRRRTKLLELDQDKLKASTERGGMITDYIELEKIKDIELRNSVLDKIGTSDFNWKLQEAINKEKRKDNEAIIISELEKFATQVENSSGLQYQKVYYTSNDEKVEVPDDVDSVEYFFIASEYGSITLYKKQEAVNTTYNEEYEEKLKKRREQKEALQEISDQAYQLRLNFIKNISNTAAKKNIGIIVEYLLQAKVIRYYHNVDFEYYAEILNIDIDIDENEEGYNEEKKLIELIKPYIQKQPERHLLILTYMLLDSSGEEYLGYQNEYRDNKVLNLTYELLEHLGYKKSDEEQKYCNGTHELFEVS